MSEHIVKIIPKDPYFHITEQKAQEINNYLKEKITADTIEIMMSKKPVFIDCGANLQSISCPLCKKLLGFDWWGEAMDKAHKNNFADLAIELPCCGKGSTLNDLLYNFPCGFASVEFDIVNPLVEPDNDCLVYIQNILEQPVHVIYAHV